MDSDALQTTAQTAASTAVEIVSNWGLQVIGALAVLIIGRWIAGMVRKGVGRSLEALLLSIVVVFVLAGVRRFEQAFQRLAGGYDEPDPADSESE